MYVNSAHTAANGDLMAGGGSVPPPLFSSFFCLSYFQDRNCWDFGIQETAFPVPVQILAFYCG